MGGVPGAVRVITHSHRGGLVRDGLANDPGRLFRKGVSPQGEILADSPEVVVHVISDTVCEFLVVIRHDMDRSPYIRHIGPWIAIEHADKGILLPGFPPPGPLHDIHGR